MGEIAINPQHNVFKQYRKVNYINPYVFAPVATYNTYIGGVSGTISTASLLATKLGISVGAISNFTIVGSDIKCKITGSYTIPISAFLSDTSITYYLDNEGLVNTVSINSFGGCSKLKKVEFPYCLTVEDFAFSSSLNLDIVYIPRCTTLGGNVGTTNNPFFNCNPKIYTNPYLATNNSGGMDGDLVGKDVIFVSNFTLPNTPILSLNASYNTALILNNSASASTNAVDFYEIYKSDILINTCSTIVANNLIANTTYTDITVKAIDVYYNKSAVSSVFSGTTSNYSYIDMDANASIAAKSLTGVEQESEYLLITGLKTNSLYTRCQSIYTFKGTTSSQHKYNSKNPVDTDAAFRLTFTGSATFSNLGYQLNGLSYADTKFTPSVYHMLNSNGITAVCGTNRIAYSSDTVDLGSFISGSQKSYLIFKENNFTFPRAAGFNANNAQAPSINNSKGIFTGTKQSATVTDLFINGNQEGTAIGGGTLPTVPIWIGCLNLSNSPYGNSWQRIQIVIFHEGFNDAEVATLHSIIDLSETIAGRKTW